MGKASRRKKQQGVARAHGTDGGGHVSVQPVEQVSTPAMHGLGLHSVEQGEQGIRAFHNGRLIATYDRLNQTSSTAAPIYMRERVLDPKIFRGAKLKIAQAWRHLENLKERWHEFGAREPVQRTDLKNESGNTVEIAFHLRTELPDEISALVGDCIHNIRTALDYLVCDLIRDNNNTTTRNNGFPSGEKDFDSKTKGIAENARKLISRIRRNPTRAQVLWDLHSLDIIDKHNRILVAVAASTHISTRIRFPGFFVTSEGTLAIGGGGPGGMPLYSDAGLPPKVHSVTLGPEPVVAITLTPGVEELCNVEIILAFGEMPNCANANIFETLENMMKIVDGVIVLCERRLR